MEMITFPTKVANGLVFPEVEGVAKTLNGEEFQLSEGDPLVAEKWSNGTIFALVNGNMRRIDNRTVKFYAKH